MRYIVLLFLVLHYVLFGSVAVSLDEAVDLALKNSNEGKISELDRKIAWQKYQQSLSALYPSLTLESKITQSNEPQTFDFHSSIDFSQMSGALGQALNLPQGAIPSSIDNDTKVQLTGKRIWQSQAKISYPLFTGGKISSLVKQAEINSQIAQLKKINDIKDLKYRVTQAYVQAWWCMKMFKIADDTKERFVGILDVTKFLMENGSTKVKKTDFLKTKSMHATISSMAKNFDMAYKMSEEYLNFLVNVNEKIEPTFELKNLQLNQKIQNASSENVAIQSQEFQMSQLASKIYKQRIKEANSGYFPFVNIEATATHLSDNYEFGYYNDENKNSYAISLGVSWKIFDGFLTSAKKQEATILATKGKLQEDLTKKAIKMQFNQAKISYESKKSQIKDLENAYKDAKENRILNQRAYAQEMVTTKDMIESQIMESIAKSSLIDAKKELILYKAKLEKLSGI